MQFAPPEVIHLLGQPEETEVDEHDSFGLHFPLPYAWSTWRRYREHGLFPRPGEYDNQYTVWLADCAVLDTRYRKHWEQAKADWEQAKADWEAEHKKGS